MAFLKIPSKPVLEQVPILGSYFMSKSELLAITKLAGFYTWSELGYYIVVDTMYTVDSSSEETLATYSGFSLD